MLKSADGVSALPLSECVAIGEVLPESVESLGLPGVLGLAPLPKEYSQSYGVPGFVNMLGVSDFTFNLLDKSRPKFRINRGCQDLSDLKAEILITPQITQPVPGLGFLTNNVRKLYVRYQLNEEKVEYTMTKVPASPELPQETQVLYQVLKDGVITSSGLMALINWYALFDTGTLTAIFHADASVNLLSPRVDNSILPGEEDPSNYVNAEAVEFTFLTTSQGLVTISATNVLIPTITPDTFADRCNIFTVFGYSMMLNHKIHFKIDTKLGLPLSVSIYN